jgi:outer membrane protein OmpA-like peptidoglycan-associated protein
MPALSVFAPCALAASLLVALAAPPARAEQHETLPAADSGAESGAEAPSCLGKARLRGELFEEDSAKLRPEVLPTLDLVAQVMKEACAGKRILIEGHTESSGDAAADQAISERRAAEVKAQLVARGVPANALDTKGFGSSRPFTKDPAQEKLNRRVTFVVEGE